MKNKTLTFGIMILVFIFSVISNFLITGPNVQADSDVIAVVNGQKLTRDELANVLIDTFGREGLELLVKRTLVMQEAKKQNVKATEKEIEERVGKLVNSEIMRQMKKGGMKDKEDLERELEKKGVTIEQYRENIIKAFKLTKEQVEAELLAEKIIKRTIEVTDEDLHEAYEDQYGERIMARQIVLRTNREAKKVLGKIKAGADFEALVKKESIDRNSAVRGGKMRPFGPHGTIGKAVANLKKGKISEIIKTESGYHILKIEKRIPRSTEEFSKVKDKLVEFVTAKKVRSRVNPWLLNLVESAEITKSLPD